MKREFNIIDILIIIALISFLFIPIVQLIEYFSPKESQTYEDHMAKILANHAMENILTIKKQNPSWLPSITEYKPVLIASGVSYVFGEYFEDFSKNCNIKTGDSNLFSILKKYNYKIDTYFSDSNKFKVVVYVTYEKNNKFKRAFAETLLSQDNLIFH